MASQSDHALSDRPLTGKKTKKLPELQAIAAVMGLDTALKRTPLLGEIQKHMIDHLGLAEDPRFTSLFAYRGASTAGEKTSADKSLEVASGGRNGSLLFLVLPRRSPGRGSSLDMCYNQESGVVRTVQQSITSVVTSRKPGKFYRVRDLASDSVVCRKLAAPAKKA
ncbi:hypothetical protein B0H14DRAFT_2609255 [Mycena olivaceomarginata]|nr:hypothetical protein B0H14DRAFT_2609255 [Mycena olivaceomarginata]